MSRAKQSLEENMDYILSKLPEEFHDDCKNCVAAAEDIPEMSEDEQKEIISASLAGVTVHEAVRALFEHEPDLSDADEPPSREEQKAMVLEALADEHKADFEKNWENEIL